MKTLYEGILADIDDTISSADKYATDMAKSEKDWKKLLKTKRTFNVMDNLYGTKIKSPELARYLTKDSIDDDLYNKYLDKFTSVHIILNYVDCIYPDPSNAITIAIKDNNDVIYVQGNVKYLTSKDCKDLDKITSHDINIPLKTLFKLQLDTMENSKLLKNLKDVKKDFANNITYTIN